MTDSIIREAPSKLRLVFLGDSITVGDGDTEFTGWPSRLMEMSLAGKLNAHCYNLGIGGDRLVNLSKRWKNEVEARLSGKTHGGIVIMIGVNDALHCAAEDRSFDRLCFAETLSEILKEAVKSWPTLLVEPAPVLPDLLRSDGARGRDVLGLLKEINACVSEVARSAGVNVCQITDRLMTDHLFERALMSGDGLHPDRSGYERVATLVSQDLHWLHFLSALETSIRC